MEFKHITSQSLRRLLSLTEKKEQLIKGIQDVENEIARTISGAATSVVKAVESVTPSKPKSKRSRKSKAKSAKTGGLKERILALLDAAGDQGLRVKEIAEKLGSKSGNISVWFSTTGKKLATKVEPGRYAAKGKAGVKAVVVATKPAAPVKASKPARKRKPSKKTKKS
ncbi:MAG: hypothetical protein ACOYM3_07305 [Terrimicrobiaceae bacterium]